MGVDGDGRRCELAGVDGCLRTVPGNDAAGWRSGRRHDDVDLPLLESRLSDGSQVYRIMRIESDVASCRTSPGKVPWRQPPLLSAVKLPLLRLSGGHNVAYRPRCRGERSTP